MTTQPAAPSAGRPAAPGVTTGAHAASADDTRKQAIATGGSIAAAALLLTAGIITLFQGIAALAEDEVFISGPEYVYELDLTSWGWVHIVFGILLVLTSLALMTGAVWAKIVAIGLACLSIVANFLWLPHYPLWSILIIALDIVIIWALATWDPARS
ncbi:hypothetical protein [Nocardia sp. NPDC024068]|uniref:DUF7144 family membrane protein n=1 Tax=Nocardia sp. NPDC024068 TaxID=3157197 RepID=UPI0033C3FAC2